ncbi:hypothetical protein BH10ACT9_BH10ACT9_36560 [soil metagenome]
MSTVVEIEFDARDRRFVLTCQGCGWVGVTTLLPTIAVPAGEHVRSCEGDRHSKRKVPYDADQFAAGARARLASVNDAPAPSPAPAPKRKPPTGQRREKLTESEVIEIRKRSVAGDGLREIAEAFGVSTPNIHAIVNRRSWKHIE